MVWLVSGIVFLATLSTASAHSNEFWQSFDSDFIHMEMAYKNNPKVKSRYPTFIRSLLEGIWGWDPGAGWDMSNGCDLNKFKSDLVHEVVSSKKQVILNEFLNRCSPVFSTNNLLAGIKVLSQKGSFQNHPFFKYSYLNYPDGLKTRALWGFKSKSKQDLIIVRPGVFSSVDELIAERYLLFLLTELNDFHVVVLENSTSGDHIVNNDIGMIAGPKEAFENLYLIDQIRGHKALAPLVNKIHLIGISLGGNGVLLSSLINQKQNHRYFDKTLLLCPVVDLKASFSVQMQNGMAPFILDWWSSRRFKDMENKKGFKIEASVSALFNLAPRWVKGFWSWLELKYALQPAWQGYLLKEFYTGDFEKDYQFFKNEVVLPDHFFALATKTDPIVDPKMNFDWLSSAATEETFFHKFDNGLHCSFAYGYQWKFLDRFFAGLLQSEPDRGVVVDKFGLFDLSPKEESLIKSATPPEIRSVEISRLELASVELLVYFHSHAKMRTGRVTMPLSVFSLGMDHFSYDDDMIRNFIKRSILIKAEIEISQDRYFIKI